MSTQILDLPSTLGGSQNTTFPRESRFPEEYFRKAAPQAHDFSKQLESNLIFFRKKLRGVPRIVADAVQVDPAIMHGNPVISGTRIPLYQIVEELADGTSFDDLMEGYPSLDSERIRRGLDFVASLLRVYDEEVSH